MSRILLTTLLLGLWVMVCGHGTAHAQTYLNFTIQQAPQLTAFAGVDQAICPGDSIPIGGVPAANGGTAPNTFMWSPSTGLANAMDSMTVAGPQTTTMYTFTVTDANGCTAMDTITVTVDTCVGLRPELGIETFSLFPNPNDGDFHILIEFNTAPGAVNLELVSLSGQRVWEKHLEKPGTTVREQVQVSSPASGIYFLRLEQNGQSVSRKIVIQ